jgi:arylsulfatase A-like enzyme
MVKIPKMPPLTRRNILTVLVAGATLALLPRQVWAADIAVKKPNIIFILADDLGQSDLGCYGQELIQTPNLDRLAAAGTRYTQAYCGTTVCAPSRTSLMTGLHMGHAPIRGNSGESLGLPAETFTVAQLLKGQGYATACIGKWGMGDFRTAGSPLKKGFDHFYGYNKQMAAHNYYPTQLFNDDKSFALPGNDKLSDKTNKKTTYSQNLIADETLGWVRAHKDEPFFLYYAVTLPHYNYEIDDLGLYKDKPWSEAEKTYAAMVTRLDSDVGRLVALLKELKLDKNTLVMFSGDNGPDKGALRRGNPKWNLSGKKRSMGEGALRQAALAWWPDVIPAGRVSDEPWAFWDFLPTVAELTGAKLPDGFQPDGLSLVAFLKGGAAPKREYFYWELHEGRPIQAIRFGNWKASRIGVDQPMKLYDLATDPSEKNDLAAAKPELVAKANTLMKNARVDDPKWPMNPK